MPAVEATEEAAPLSLGLHFLPSLFWALGPPDCAGGGGGGCPLLLVVVSLFLSPRKLHPVLRAEHAEKDRFATGQKNYFFGCLMNVILDVGKKITFLVLCNSSLLNATFFTFLWRSECARPRALKMFKVEFITKPKHP